MANIKSAADIAAKWGRVTPLRTEDYEEGIRNPVKDWKTNTANAESSYSEGVQKAVSNKSFSKGVADAGTSKWQEKTIAKGLDRWGPGVSAATDDYEAGFAPYREVIAKTTLPQRYSKGDPRNLNRVKAITEALHAAKVG